MTDPASKSTGRRSRPTLRLRSLFAVMRHAMAPAVILLSVAVLWAVTPLSDYIEAAHLRAAAEEVRRHDWAPLIVLLAYLGASPTFFPITLLNVITAVAFGPAQAFILCLAGSMLNAAFGFGLGRLVGRKWLRRYTGPRLARISRRLGRGGVPAVVGMMVAPLGPYTFVNMVCGASHIRFLHHQLGVLLGLAPTLALLVVLGDGLWRLIEHPTVPNMAVLAAIVAAWTLGGLGLQYLLERRPGSRSAEVRRRVADRKRRQHSGTAT